MPRIYVDFAGMKQIADDCRNAANKVDSIRSRLYSTISRLDWDVRFAEGIDKTAKQINSDLNADSDSMRKYRNYVLDAQTAYLKVENVKSDWAKNITPKASWGAIVTTIGSIVTKGTTTEKSDSPKVRGFLKDWWSELGGWKGLFKGSCVGKFIGWGEDLSKAVTWSDVAKVGYKAYDFVKDASKKYNNYMKIGRAIGTGKARANWAKKLLGLNKVYGRSKAKNVFTRFKNNLTNKTSPYNLKATFKDAFDGFKFKKGNVGKAAASWMGLVLDGVSNYKANKQEQAENGMSDARVIGETVVETGTNFLLSTGATAIVGAAAAAVLPFSAPAVAIAAVGGLAVSGINAGIKALTGKTATEHISDFVMDFVESPADAVKNVGKAVASGVSKAADAVKSGVKSIGNKIGNCIKSLPKPKWRIFA